MDNTISFLSPMVKAIADGNKTVTRRPVRTQPPEDYHCFGIIKQEVWFSKYDKEFTNLGCPSDYVVEKCRYAPVGSVLRITEPWKVYKNSSGAGIRFYDGFHKMHSNANAFKESNGSWRSANSLPRWATRYKVKVTDITVEKLQVITDVDIKKEGMFLDYLEQSNNSILQNLSSQDLFIAFWNFCYHTSYPWESNPWVFVISFELAS